MPKTLARRDSIKLGHHKTSQLALPGLEGNYRLANPSCHVHKVCPLPHIWAQIHANLERAWQSNDQKRPPPPIPLILGGWDASNDVEKQNRWNETVKWASDSGNAHLIPQLEVNEFYSVTDLTSYLVGPRGGPMYLEGDHTSKRKPDPEEIKAALAALQTHWSRIAGTELGRATEPVRFTGRKRRRLIVRVNLNVEPPWGSWEFLSPIEGKRRTFTEFRSSVNRCIKPVFVDHIDFDFGTKFTMIRSVNRSTLPDGDSSTGAP